MDSLLGSFPGHNAAQPGGPTIKDHPLFTSKPLMFALREISNYLWGVKMPEPFFLFGVFNMSKQKRRSDSLVFALEYAA